MADEWEEIEQDWEWIKVMLLPRLGGLEMSHADKLRYVLVQITLFSLSLLSSPRCRCRQATTTTNDVCVWWGFMCGGRTSSPHAAPRLARRNSSARVTAGTTKRSLD
jgi:hypothetical protein